MPAVCRIFCVFTLFWQIRPAVLVQVGTFQGVTTPMGSSAESFMRLPSFSGHPICTDLVSVGEDVHCESTAQEVHAGVSA